MSPLHTIPPSVSRVSVSPSSHYRTEWRYDRGAAGKTEQIPLTIDVDGATPALAYSAALAEADSRFRKDPRHARDTLEFINMIAATPEELAEIDNDEGLWFFLKSLAFVAFVLGFGAWAYCYIKP